MVFACYTGVLSPTSIDTHVDRKAADGRWIIHMSLYVHILYMYVRLLAILQVCRVLATPMSACTVSLELCYMYVSFDSLGRMRL